MRLTELGFDDWCQAMYHDRAHPGFDFARVTRVDRDRYLVRGEHDEVQAEPTGRLLFSSDSSQNLPCVGDWVLIQYHNGGTLAIIHEVLPRKTHLRRKAPGKNVEYQMIAANIDYAFIMQSCDLNFNIRRMERYLVMVNEGKVEPVILLSKSDLVSAEEQARRVTEIRDARVEAPIFTFSNLTQAGLQELRQAIQPCKTYCMLGSSGVGKTTLLNHLLGRDVFETQPVREKDGRGRHTTARRQLSLLDTGALLIDTPGMRELGLMAAGENVDESFSDIRELTMRCRFSDCSHSVEVGCALLEAVESGQLDQERYKSYMKLVKESRFHEMTYVERRRKEKRFGRMVKAAMQQLKKHKPSSY
jgi:ribosome biogenesis GTPase